MGSCMECGAKFGVCFLVILNTLCLLLGVGIMVVGILLKTDVDKDSDIMDFLDKVNFGSLTLGDIINILIIVVIVIGAFCVVTAVLGSFGAICRVRVMLTLYVIILVLCILMEVAILYFWVTLMKGTNDWLKGEFNSLLGKYEGPKEKDIFSIGWNLIFILFKCCGVEPTTSGNNDFQDLPSKWWSASSRGSDVIPTSCCTDFTIDRSANYTNTQCTQSLQGYHTSGCYDVFQDLFTTLSTVALVVISGLVIVEVISIIFSIIITYVESKKSKGQVV